MNWYIQLIGISTLLKVEAFDNYFQLNSSSVSTDRARGVICFDYNEYIPSCGWTLVLSANKNLTGVMADGVIVSRQAPYIFRLQNTWCNKDLSSRPINLCLNVSLYAQFNNVKPAVYVGWQQICNSSTAGLSKAVPYHYLMPYNSYPSNDTGYLMTKQYAPTLSSVMGLCPNASMSRSAILQFTGYYRYNGQHLVNFPNTLSTISCCLICLNTPLCLGVNYIVGDNLCQVITEFIDLNMGMLNNSSNSLYWNVTGRT